jgi:radical SAM enzyme (TIGR01210 family)
MNNVVQTTPEDALRQYMVRTVKFLREEYYKHHGEEYRKEFFAFGGKSTESIGSFAEYNLRGRRCIFSAAGNCVPCFYSRFPEIIGINNDYTNVLIAQIDNIIDNFQHTVVDKQDGECIYRKEDLYYKSGNPIPLCITPVGSFFNEKEFPRKVRKHLLERLEAKSNELERDIFLYVETHVKDFNCTVDNLSEKEKELLSRLHLRIVFGFESRNDFVRNILYCKGLDIKDFEHAIEQAKFLGYGTYAFVFVGLYPMSQKEIVSDVRESLLYLRKLRVVPTLMFANYQEYTISNLLLKNGKEKPLSPITVLEIIRIMLETIAGQNTSQDDWLMADPVGGPPEPEIHIFSNPSGCDCNTEIYNLIKLLRKNHNTNELDIVCKKISTCKLHDDEYKELHTDDEIPMIERTKKMLYFVNEQKEIYCQELREKEVLLAKASLLCHGVKLDENARRELLRLGVTDGFVHSTNLMIDGEPINACVIESFIDNQDYIIRFYKGKFYLYNEPPQDKYDVFPQSLFVGEINFLKVPTWGDKIVDGIYIKEYLRPHSQHCISIWPNQNCFLKNEKCAFCSLSSNATLPPETILKMVNKALSSGQNYEVHLSGGLYKDFEQNVKYYSTIAGLIHRQFPYIQISLETIPPLSRDGLLTYKANGITSIIMNLEIANEQLRKKLCPGKTRISRDRYFEAFKEAVEIFGRWNVGSVLIWGIEGQTKEAVFACVKEMCTIGVMPILLPFQPLKGCELTNKPRTNVIEYISVAEAVAEMLNSNKKADEHFCDFGCINCGACSLEKNLIRRK